MKKALLASTALAGAALLSAPAQAGTVGSGDNLSVTLSGFMWFQAHVLDEDLSTGFGRGYDFDINESELHINARNTADNGLTYGVSGEIELNTDHDENADEIWAFVDGDFGRVELGDQDDATNRMLVGAFQAHKGLSGPFGGLGGLTSVFHLQHPAFLSRTDWQVATSTDRTKITYFSPRFAGFQVGASFTPDFGGNGSQFGGSENTDNVGDYEKAVGLGLNYTGKFDDVGISVSGLYEHAEDEGSPAPTKEDLDFWYVGAKVDFAGFTVGANYRDNGDSFITSANEALGEDAGDYWAVAVGYQQGPWGVSVWYSNGEKDNPSTAAESETSVERWGVGGQYSIAPGWQIRADYNFIEHDNIGGTTADNDSQAVILTNMISF